MRTPRIVWDGRITAGNVLTIVSLVAAITAWGARVESGLSAEVAARTAEMAGIQNEISDTRAMMAATDADAAQMRQQIAAQLSALQAEWGTGRAGH